MTGLNQSRRKLSSGLRSIILTYGSTPTLAGFSFTVKVKVCSPPGGPVSRTTELQRDIVLIQNGVLEEKVSTVSHQHTTYDQIVLDDDCDGITDGFLFLSDFFGLESNEGSLRDSSQITPIAFGNLVGSRWAFSFFYDQGVNGFFPFNPLGEGLATDLLSFGGGNGGAKISGVNFSWSEAAGVLTIDHQSPSNESLTQKITLLDKLDGVQGAFYDLTNNDTGARIGTYGLAVKQDPNFDFAAVNNFQADPGNFWNSSLNAHLRSQYDANGDLHYFNYFGWVNNSGFMRNQLFYFDQAGLSVRADRELQFINSFSTDMIFRGPYFFGCYNGPVVCHKRIWTPLMQDSDGSVWYLENAFTDFSNPNDPLGRHGVPRINVVDQIAIPPSQVVTPLEFFP